MWTRLGRRVVGNLSTVSTSVQDFTVLLLGIALIERSGTKRAQADAFLTWEQMVAYARATELDDFRFRGTERVRRRLAEGGRVTLGTSDSAQILSKQRTYGLWGLYSAPAKASGLLEDLDHRLALTPPAHTLIEELLPILMRHEGAIEAIAQHLDKQASHLRTDGKGTDGTVLKAIAAAIAPLRTRTRALYRDHLLHGGPVVAADPTGTGRRQVALARILASEAADRDWSLSHDRVRQWQRAARKMGADGEDLADHLARISTAERLIAMAAALFGFLMQRDGTQLAACAGMITRQWGSAPRRVLDMTALRLHPEDLELEPGDRGSAERMLRLAEALIAGDAAAALRMVTDQNAAVMARRSKGGPWIEWRQDAVAVRFRDEQDAPLPDREGIHDFWRHQDYFIRALRLIGLGLGRPS
ncbi:MAG: hypothetical protein RLZZ127_1576 [Planctomycetota bacterium]|jgi:hypothetical protein